MEGSSMIVPTTAARARALLAAWRAEMHRSYVVHGVTPVTYGDPDIARDIAELDEVIAGLAAPQAVQDDYALTEMEARKDAAYLERNQVVAALAKCFSSGVARTAIEGWSEDWHGCVYIDLPTGQASWHFHDSHAHLFTGLPPYTKPWDGHSTEEKYGRLSALAQAEPMAWLRCEFCHQLGCANPLYTAPPAAAQGGQPGEGDGSC